MAHRFQEITEVYRQELAALARGDKWTAFLRSACRNYKLHFEEQVLVHAQRPDATAVLEMAHWNRRFDRWVDPGSTGIAVFDRDTPGRARLKYYFDISDTHEGRFHRPVPLWQVSAEQEPEIVEALEHRFGALAQKEMLGTPSYPLWEMPLQITWRIISQTCSRAGTAAFWRNWTS